MKKLACKDIGVSATCGYEAFGETEDEVVDQGVAHAKDAHGDELVALGVDDVEVRAALASQVKETGEDEPEAE